MAVDAHPEAHPVPGGIVSGQRDRSPFHDLGIVLPMGAVDHEGIGVQTADDAAGVLHHFAQMGADPPEHLVAVGAAVALVDHVEMVDVHQDRVHLQILVELVELLGVAVEELLVVEARQFVAFCGLDDVLVLGQLDDALNSGQDHVDGGIGLGNEVDSAQLQAFHFRFPFRGRDDDGNAGEGAVVLDGLEDLQAGHDRHEDVQKDQRQRVLMLTDHGHGFRAVSGEQDLVFPLQDLTEQLPVNHLIIRHEDLPFSVC